MHTKTQKISAIDLNSNNVLSIAMTTLRISVPGKSRKKSLCSGRSKEALISLEEISWHDNDKDCWVVIYDRVYDLTNFLDEHPGGHDVLLEYAGRDATIAFRGVGHSTAAIKTLDRFQIGELPLNERIFRTPTGIKLSGIPV